MDENYKNLIDQVKQPSDGWTYQDLRKLNSFYIGAILLRDFPELFERRGVKEDFLVDEIKIKGTKYIFNVFLGTLKKDEARVGINLIDLLEDSEIEPKIKEQIIFQLDLLKPLMSFWFS